jgi:ribose transport system substrate-binding protein
MSDLLASLSGIDGIWTQDGMAQGVLTALRAASPEPFPIMTGEAISGYLKLWNETRQEHPEFTSIGVVNPPGVGASGLRVAVEILQGGTVDESQLGGPFDNSLYVPIPLVVTQDNFDEVFAEYGDRADTYVIDDVITQEQAAAFME